MQALLFILCGGVVGFILGRSRESIALAQDLQAALNHLFAEHYMRVKLESDLSNAVQDLEDEKAAHGREIQGLSGIRFDQGGHYYCRNCGRHYPSRATGAGIDLPMDEDDCDYCRGG